MRHGRAGIELLLPVLPFLAAAPCAPAAAQATGPWTPEERVLVSDFSNITGLASDAFRVYAATPNGLLTWDPALARWSPPLTFEDGYPVAEQPGALAWSDGEQALVLGTAAGRLWRLDPVAGRAEPLAAVPGAVESLVGVRGGDLYIGTRSGWFSLAPGSMAPQAADAPPAGARPGADPRLRSLSGVLGLDENLRRWPVTALTPGTRPDEYYVGTAGGGLLRVDARTLQVTSLPYGTTGRAVGAVARWRGRVWFGTLAPARGRASIASADTTLQRWRWPDPRQGAPAAAVSALAVAGDVLWAGAADGLYRAGRDGSAWDRFGSDAGLPSDAVTALATFDTVIWIGTRRGACLWRGAGCGPTLLPGMEVTALAYCAGALWLGTGQGLWRATAEQIARADPPAATGDVQALACAAGTLYVAGARELFVLRGQSWAPSVPLGGGGAVRAMAPEGDAVWVGGDAGAARWDPAARAWSTYLVPNDIPAGPVLGVLPGGDRVWLATPAGALRLDRRAR